MSKGIYGVGRNTTNRQQQVLLANPPFISLPARPPLISFSKQETTFEDHIGYYYSPFFVFLPIKRKGLMVAHKGLIIQEEHHNAVIIIRTRSIYIPKYFVWDKHDKQQMTRCRQCI